MSRANRICLQVESLDDRLTPSSIIGTPDAFDGVMVAHAQPTDPCTPVSAVSISQPTTGTVSAVTQIGVIDHQTPTDPCRTLSPVLYGLG
jgi:hypothetical protein